MFSFCVKSRTNSIFTDISLISRIFFIKTSKNQSWLKEETAREYLIERDKLFSEIAEIEGGTYTAHLELMRQILADYDENLSGETAVLYDALWDAFEEVKVDG